MNQKSKIIEGVEYDICPNCNSKMGIENDDNFYFKKGYGWHCAKCEVN